MRARSPCESPESSCSGVLGGDDSGAYLRSYEQAIWVKHQVGPWPNGLVCGAMKLVIGIVRPERANQVLEALFRADVRGISISRVQGHGGELDRVETYRGTTVKMELSEKLRFEIAVSEAFVQTTIDALCEGARTGQVGDGKIFVIDLEQAVRIRTGETDAGAVTPLETA